MGRRYAYVLRRNKRYTEMYAEDMGLAIEFKYIQNVEELMENIGNERKDLGFLIYIS